MTIDRINLQTLLDFNEYQLIIRRNEIEDKYQIAQKLKKMLLIYFDEVIYSLLKGHFGIDVLSTGIGKYFRDSRLTLENSVKDINLAEIVKIQEFDTTSSDKPSNPSIKFHNSAWFQVGLLYASGAIDDMINENINTSSEMARLKFPNNPSKYRPYISESRNEDQKSSQNIFKYPKKIKQIIDYCDENDIKITSKFRSFKST